MAKKKEPPREVLDRREEWECIVKTHIDATSKPHHDRVGEDPFRAERMHGFKHPDMERLHDPNIWGWRGIEHTACRNATGKFFVVRRLDIMKWSVFESESASNKSQALRRARDLNRVYTREQVPTLYTLLPDGTELNVEMPLKDEMVHDEDGYPIDGSGKERRVRVGDILGSEYWNRFTRVVGHSLGDDTSIACDVIWSKDLEEVGNRITECGWGVYIMGPMSLMNYVLEKRTWLNEQIASVKALGEVMDQILEKS